jgi:hypothetical protein
MKIKDYPFNHEIKTVGELRQYVGLPLYFYYNGYYKKTNINKILYAWIKTLAYVNGLYDANRPVSGVGTWGYNTLQMVKNYKEDIKFVSIEDHKTQKHSNAQEYIRTLTREEFDLYKKMTLKRRLVPNWIKKEESKPYSFM